MNDENCVLMAKEALDSAKSAHKRLDAFGDAIKNMNSIAIDVKGLAGDVKLAVSQLVDVKDRVSKVECYQDEEQKVKVKEKIGFKI